VAAAGAAFSWSQRAAAPALAVDLDHGRPKLLQLGMGICEQCRKMEPVMHRAAAAFGTSVDVHVLDVRQAAAERIAERYRMRVMPLVLLVDGAGRELWRHEGYIDFDALTAVVRHRLGEAPAPASRGT